MALLAGASLAWPTLAHAAAVSPPASVAVPRTATHQPSRGQAPAATPAPQANWTQGAGGVLQTRLPNGLTVLVRPDHRSPTAVHMLWLRAGSIDEVDGTSGVAHALEHMMFKGSALWPAGAFSRQVAALGGRENAFTSRDYTAYFQQIPAARLAEVMALEADRFASNRWPDAEFAKEIEVIKEERRLRTEDNPRALLHEALNAAAFVASPYHRPIIGWMGDLDSLQAQDVRDFYQRWYQPANAALVVTGDVQAEQVYRLALQHYGTLPGRALPQRKPRPEPVQRGVRRLQFKAPAEQAWVTLAFKVPGLDRLDDAPPHAASARGNDQPAVPAGANAPFVAPAGAGSQPAAAAGAAGATDEDALALTVLAAVLDGYSGARLDRALTQGPQRVADQADASYELFARGPRLFVLSAVPAPGQTAEQVEQALRAQVQRIAQDGVEAAELERVKVQWLAAEVYKRDSVFNQARELGTWWALGLPMDSGERLVQRLRGVTAEQVQAVAARYFGDDQLTVAVLDPQAPERGRKPVAAPSLEMLR